MSISDACAGFALFSGLTAQERDLACGAGRDVTFVEGARLFSEGESAWGCWLLHQGRVAIDTTVPGRGLVVVQTLGPGDVLGWSWLVPPYQWHFGARAIDTVRATELDTVRLRALAEQDPQFGYALSRQLMKILLDRLQSTRARLLDLYGAPDAG